MNTTIEAITINKYQRDLIDRVHFVLKARASAKDDRPPLQCIKFETKDDECYCYATDGLRLHLADLSDIKYSGHILGGLYHVKKCTKSSIDLILDTDKLVYPDVWQFIPDFPLRLENIEVSVLNGIYSAYASIIRATKGVISFDYFKDMIMSDIYPWNLYYRDKHSPYVFKTNNGLTAVVMPIFTK